MKRLIIFTTILCFFALNTALSQGTLIQPSFDEIITTKYGGSEPNLAGRHTSGTAGTPSATAADLGLVTFSGRGHTGSAFTTDKVQIKLSADELFSPTSNGTRITFATTLNGSTSMLERMRIDNNGNVGIGTLSPGEKLEVLSSVNNIAKLTTTQTSGYLRFFMSTNNVTGYIGTYNDAVNKGFEVGTSGVNTTGSLFLTTQAIPRLTVLPAGNVGVGTTTPDTKLQVVGGENDGVNASLKITSGAQSMLLDGNEIDALATGLYLNNNTNLNVILATGGGNVGIGTTTPDNKLDVLGIIRANEVIVETGWADYVFKDDYQLKPLDEVETFIKENKHLPSLPSAANIQEKGAHVAELMTKMMEKIEELTLYSIQQKKEIDALKKRLDEKK